jgi:hypothetical protein
MGESAGHDDGAGQTAGAGPGTTPPEHPPSSPADDLGRLRALSGWDGLFRRLGHRRLLLPLIVAWWLASTMLTHLEDQLSIMHLPGDRSFNVASMERAGTDLTQVLTSWRRWQLAVDPATVIGPGQVILHQLVLRLALPAVTATLLAVVARKAWSACGPGFRRQIAAFSIVAAPAALVLMHLRDVLVAITAFGGIGMLAAAHLGAAVAVTATTAALAWRRSHPGAPIIPLVVAIGAGSAAMAIGATLVLPPCAHAGCAADPAPGAAIALATVGGGARLVVAGILVGSVLAAWDRIGNWLRTGGPARAWRAALAVRGQVLAVAPIALLPLLGTSDLGLQVHNTVSRLVESPGRSVAFVVAVAALMVTLAAFGQHSARSAARPGTTSAGDPDGPSRRPWLMWVIAVGAAAVALAARLLLEDLYGIQALAIVVAIGALLSAPPKVARLTRADPIADEAATTVIEARSLVVTLVPLALATVAARLALTPANGLIDGRALMLTVTLTALALVSHDRRRQLVDWCDRRGGWIVIIAATGVVAGLALWGALDPVTFGFALGSVLTMVVVTAAVAVAAGWLVLVGNRLTARGALAAVGFRRVPTLLAVLTVGLVATTIDPTPAANDVRMISATTEPDQRAVPLEEALGQWADALDRPERGQDGRRTPVPMVFVATAGGGIKAAYWTTLILGCLQEASDAGPRCPAGATVPRQNLFLASGISGGSLGLAIDHVRHARDSSGPVPPAVDDVLDTTLAADFLAPDVAALVLRDAPNAVLHARGPADRAAVLEDAWARGLRDAGDTTNGLDSGFFASTATTDGTGRVSARFPLLVLNSATVEDRCRLAVTALDVAPAFGGRSCVADPVRSGARPDAVISRTKKITDFVCDDHDLRLSTATLLSARFPWVSPYGQLQPCESADPPGRATSFAVDGGLVEASAAGPLPELLAALGPALDSWEARPANAGLCLAPRLVMIEHGYGLDTREDPPAAPGQLRAPRAFFSADSAVSAAAQQQAVTAFTRLHSARGCGEASDDPVAYFALTLHPGQRAPLGWTLSRAARRDMDDQLSSDANRCRLVTARQWFAPAHDQDPTPVGADSCVTGTLPVIAGREADVRGARIILWERRPGEPAARAVATTVADAEGRFDLPVTVIPEATYRVCFRPGEGEGAVSGLGERWSDPVTDTDAAGPGRTSVPLRPNRVTTVGPSRPVARC